MFDLILFWISIFDNLLNNLIQLTNLLISMEILGNYDTKTNQSVLTPKQLNFVFINCQNTNSTSTEPNII